MANPFAAQLADALENSWPAIARPNQLPPPGDWWQIWLLLAGRGFGKTRTLAEWVCQQTASGQAGRIALVTATAADARDVLVEGESGILAVAPPWFRPVYEPSKRRLTWPNGAMATTFSAEEPERLRGPQHDAAVCDELGAWSHPETWDMLQFGLRLGGNPRCLVATTPRPTRLIRELLAREGRDVAVTRGSTYENRANLAPGFFDQVIRKYEGTRLGRQELNAELLEDTPGALWSHGIIEAARQAAAPNLARIVVAVDPAASSGEDADETGIVVVGKDTQGHGYVLADASGKHQPIEWAKIAIAAYRAHRADRIVAERNNGGAMVEATIRMIDNNVPVTTVWASRGKVARAEPVSALYEQGRVQHVGEDYREVIAAYHRAVAKIIAESDGFVSRYMGDGVLVYFGYPQAHEDDAERAVRAGLASIDAVGRLDVKSVALQARVGIATGLAAVGGLIGEGSAQ